MTKLIQLCKLMLDDYGEKWAWCGPVKHMINYGRYTLGKTGPCQLVSGSFVSISFMFETMDFLHMYIIHVVKKLFL